MDWYPHHIDDFDADTIEFSLTHEAIYLRLLRWYYKHERPLPCDDKQLAIIARISLATWRGAGPVILKYFQANGDGRLHHKRCDKEIAETQRRRTLSVERKKRFSEKSGTRSERVT